MKTRDILHLKPGSNTRLLLLDAWGSTQNSRNRHLASNKRLVVQRSKKINRRLLSIK